MPQLIGLRRRCADIAYQTSTRLRLPASTGPIWLSTTSSPFTIPIQSCMLKATIRMRPLQANSCSHHHRHTAVTMAYRRINHSMDGQVRNHPSDPETRAPTDSLGLLGLPTVNSNAYVHGNPQAPPPPPQGMMSFGSGAPQGYGFQYSNCTGRRKALLIGINYFGQRGQLRGCINDVKNMSAYLNEVFGYKREDMVILTDDQQNPMSQPTKQNILRAMHWLVKDARPNDSLFFHYSGMAIFVLEKHSANV